MKYLDKNAFIKQLSELCNLNLEECLTENNKNDIYDCAKAIMDLFAFPIKAFSGYLLEVDRFIALIDNEPRYQFVKQYLKFIEVAYLVLDDESLEEQYNGKTNKDMVMEVLSSLRVKIESFWQK